MRLIALLFGVTLLGNSLGCGKAVDPCNPPVCPTSRLTPHVVSARATLKVGELAETQTTLDSGMLSTSNGHCDVSVDQTFASDGSALAYDPVVDCVSQAGHVTANLAMVRDPRGLGLGTHRLTPAEAGVDCGPSCASTMTTIEVTRADGAAAPYPTIVSGDYARNFTVHVEALYEGGTQTGATSLDLEIEETAADYHYDPNALCGCL